jgi:short-subunit dehydrogenase
MQKIVWITGASSGIGEALAYAFARRGATLILSARNETELTRVKNNCTSPEKVHLFPLDIANHCSAFKTGNEILEKFGHVDILINNAGVSQRSMASKTQFLVDKSIINTNFLGTVAVTKSVLPAMVSRKVGHIVVISSVVGKIGTPLRSSYAASKHALHGFFDSLRAEVADKNIGVLLVCPGFVQTNISINALTAHGTKQDTMDNAIRNGLSPDYVADKIIEGMTSNREEIWIAGLKELLAINTKRFFPKLFSKMISKIKVV